MSTTRKRGIRREDFREVRPTESELADWARRNPSHPKPSVYRAEHLPCGRRIWYSGVGIGSHLRACPGRMFATFTVDAPAGTVQVVACDVLGANVSVTQGAWTEVTLAPRAAELLIRELRARGYTVAE